MKKIFSILALCLTILAPIHAASLSDMNGTFQTKLMRNEPEGELLETITINITDSSAAMNSSIITNYDSYTLTYKCFHTASSIENDILIIENMQCVETNTNSADGGYYEGFRSISFYIDIQGITNFSRPFQASFNIVHDGSLEQDEIEGSLYDWDKGLWSPLK